MGVAYQAAGLVCRENLQKLKLTVAETDRLLTFYFLFDVLKIPQA